LYSEKKRKSFGSGWRGSGKAKRDSNLAMANFKNRSKRSQTQDLHKYADIAPNIVAYLKAPSELDWPGVDSPSKLSELAKKGNVEMVVKDVSQKDKPKTNRFKIREKTDKDVDKPKELAKSDDNNPILEKPTHKMPSQDEIFRKAQALYMAEKFKPKYNDSEPEVLPTRGELAEEGYLQKAKLALMTSEDTQASRATFDYIDNLRGQLEKIGFTIEPIAGFDVSDLQY
jgi:hypothetical protein